MKEGINLNEDDPNYDLFKLSCRVSAKRLFPNFSFLDAPFNLKYYKPNNPETEATYMGCRTRVMNNICGECEVSGRGNLSFTTINLPRLGIEHGIIKNKKADLDGFFKDLDNNTENVYDLAHSVGKIYILLKNSKGTYSPKRVVVKRFNSQEFPLIKLKDEGNPIAVRLFNMLDQTTKIIIDGIRTNNMDKAYNAMDTLYSTLFKDLVL